MTLPRRIAIALALLPAIALFGCGHPAERALSGRWLGERVENFDLDDVAAATAWARGTSFDFEGHRLTVAVPAEEPRTGTYRLVAIEEQKVRLNVLDSDGEQTDLDLIVDDSESLRWVLGEGRSLVMKKAH
jgi:hypothetical protein